MKCYRSQYYLHTQLRLLLSGKPIRREQGTGQSPTIGIPRYTSCRGPYITNAPNHEVFLARCPECRATIFSNRAPP